MDSDRACPCYAGLLDLPFTRLLLCLPPSFRGTAIIVTVEDRRAFCSSCDFARLVTWVVVRDMAPVSQVFLRRLDGKLSVVHATTVADVFAAVSEEARLVTGTRDLSTLAPDACLADLGVVDGSTVTALARLLGGGKKRKKKTYTKPKKQKHKHKKVKMAVLNYYKIGDDGKVERLRRECPEDSCGAGIFMADHKDRFYCGKCGCTYIHDEKKKA